MANDLKFGISIVAKDLASKEFSAIRAGVESVGNASAAADAKGGFSKTREGIKSISEQLDSARKLYLGFQAAQQAVAAGRDITDRADAYASFAARLKLATGSAQGFQTALAEVQRIATATQAPVETVAQLYARLSTSLRAMGQGQAQVVNITETVALALKISGASATEAGAAMLQLSQAFASGVLRGDEFNSVNEAAPRLMQALAESLNVPVGELRKMAEEGKLTSDVLAENLPKAMQKLREEAAQIPATVGGAFQQLSDSYTRYIGQTSEATGLSSGLAATIKTLAEHFGLLGDAVIALALGAAVAGLIGIAGAAGAAATAAGAATLSIGGLRIALMALSATPIGAFITLATTLGAIVFGASRLKQSLQETSQTAKEEAEKIASTRKELEGRLDALTKNRGALEKKAAEDAKAGQKDLLEGQKKSIAEQINDAEKLRDALIKAYEDAGEAAMKHRDKAKDLRGKADDKRRDLKDKAEDRQLSTLEKSDPAAAETARQVGAGEALRQAEFDLARATVARYEGNTAAAEKYTAEIDRHIQRAEQLAGALKNDALAQRFLNAAGEMSARNLDAQAAAEEAKAAKEDARQQAIAQQQQANAQSLADFQAKLATVEASLKALAGEKDAIKIRADQAAIEKVKSDIASVQAELAKLPNEKTITIKTVTSGGDLPKKAAGGLITGPGHDTSDNLLAWLSPGEFVLRAAAVRRWGVDRLAALNAGRMPRFAAGGLVTRAVSSLPRYAEGGGLQPINLTLPGLGTWAMQAAPAVAQDFAAVLRREAMKRGG